VKMRLALKKFAWVTIVANLSNQELLTSNNSFFDHSQQ
jgi:hypothetical protein